MNSSCWMVYQFDPHVSTGSAFRLCCSYSHFAPQRVPFASDSWDVHPGVVSGTSNRTTGTFVAYGDCMLVPSHSPGISFPSAPDISPRATARESAHDMQDEARWRSETPNHSLMGRYFHRIEISMGCRDIYIINNGFYCTLSG